MVDKDKKVRICNGSIILQHATTRKSVSAMFSPSDLLNFPRISLRAYLWLPQASQPLNQKA